jgi:hypothetical protein
MTKLILHFNTRHQAYTYLLEKAAAKQQAAEVHFQEGRKLQQEFDDEWAEYKSLTFWQQCRKGQPEDFPYKAWRQNDAFDALRLEAQALFAQADTIAKMRKEQCEGTVFVVEA